MISEPSKLAIVLGMALFAALLALGAYLLFKRAHRQQSAAVLLVSAPSVTGRVVETRIDVMNANTEDSSFVPRVRYTYQVGGADYENDVVRIGLAGFGYPFESQAAAHLARYPLGSEVSVFYQSDNPKHSVLEPGQVGTARLTVAAALLGIVAVFLLGCATWIALLPTE
jgi:hypothetical protein